MLRVLIDRIEVAGFRSFANKVVIGDLNKINVFIGKNNVGKTNIVEILRLLNDLIAGRTYRSPEEFITRRHQKVSLILRFTLESNERAEIIDRLFKNGATHTRDAMTTNFLKTITHSLEIGPQGLMQETVSASNLESGEVVVWGLFIDERTNQFAAKGCDLSLACRGLPKIRDLSVTLETRLGFGSPIWASLVKEAIRSTDFLPAMIREMYEKVDWVPPIRQSQVQMPPTEVKRLDSSGSNLPQVWNTIVSDEPKELVKIGVDIKRIVGISSISAPVKGSQTVPSFKEASDDSFNLANTSSGVQQAAILATKIRTCQSGGILLIEEPELHLHAGAQRVLREIIEKRSSDVQFFITTHSTIFADLRGESNVFLVTKNGRQSTVRSISDLADLQRIKSELGHSNVDLYGYDLLVFVEGDSEEVAIPIIASCLGLDFRGGGILLKNLRGASKVKKLGDYLKYLKDSGTAPFIVADGNKEVKDRISDWEESGLLPKGNCRIWKQEFEDLFPVSLIAECLKELGYTGVSGEELEAQKGTGSVVHRTRQLIHKTAQPELDKPALAEAIARKVCVNKDLLPVELKELLEVLQRSQRNLDVGETWTITSTITSTSARPTQRRKMDSNTNL